MEIIEFIEFLYLVFVVNVVKWVKVGDVFKMLLEFLFFRLLSIGFVKVFLVVVVLFFFFLFRFIVVYRVGRILILEE